MQTHVRLDRRPVALDHPEAGGGVLTPLPGEDEPAHSVLDPCMAFDGPGPDPAVASDHDETVGADDGEPHVVDAAAGHVRERRVARVDDGFGMELRQTPAEEQIVL